MPQYLALIYGPTDQQVVRPDDLGGEMMADYAEFGAAAEAAGVVVGGNALQSTETATTVSVLGGKGGEVVTTDGPFAETKEVLGGYYLLDCRRPGSGHEPVDVASGMLVTTAATPRAGRTAR